MGGLSLSDLMCAVKRCAGSAEGTLIVSDIEGAHDEFVGRGVDVSEV